MIIIDTRGALYVVLMGYHVIGKYHTYAEAAQAAQIEGRFHRN